MSRAKYLFLSILLLVTAASCVHEFPDEATPADFMLKVQFNIGIEVNANVNADIHNSLNTNSMSGTRSLDSETHDIRYIVKFFRLVNGEMATDPIYEHTFTVDDINVHEFEESLEIAEGQYRIYVWGDYVEQGGFDDHHYKTDGFPRIELNLPETGQYEGSLESRDAYVGHTDIDVVRYGKDIQPVEANIDIHRPLAKFVIISNDLEEFVTKITQQRLSELKEQASVKAVDIDEFDVKFFFQGDESTIYNAPTTFDVFSDKPVATSPGLSFTSKLTEVINNDTGMKEAQLGFDYIFVNGTDAHTRVIVGVYDQEGEQIAMTPSIKIPLKRNHVTYVRDGFLMHNVEGGVEINSGFAGPDFNYEIK